MILSNYIRKQILLYELLNFVLVCPLFLIVGVATHHNNIAHLQLPKIRKVISMLSKQTSGERESGQTRPNDITEL